MRRGMTRVMLRAAVAAAPALTLALILTSTGCSWRKHRASAPTAVPPPKAPLPTVLPAPPPPKIETASPAGNTPPPAVSTKLPDSPKPPPQKKTVRRAKATPTPPKPALDKPSADPGSTGEPVQPPAPRIGELLTESQRNDLLRQCDQTTARARASIERVAAKHVAGADAEAVERVRALIDQAELAKNRDPQTALQLAQRADVLAADLLKSLK